MQRVSLSLLLLVLLTEGAVLNWTGSAESWNEPVYWSGGNAPLSVDSVWMNMADTSAIIGASDTVSVAELVIGRHALNVSLTMNGGTLSTLNGEVFIGQYEDASGALTMSGGAHISSQTEFSVGVSGAGSLIMDNASLTVGSHFTIGRYNKPEALGSVVLNGQITCADFTMNMYSSLDLQHGSITIDGNRLSRINSYLSAGLITSSTYPTGIKVDYDLTHTGKTTLSVAGGTYYVSPTGSASGDGSFTAPFQSLFQARDHLINLAAQNALPAGDTTIYMRGGTYHHASTLELNPSQFSGSMPALKIEPYAGESVTVCATTPVDSADFSLPTDAETLARIRPEVTGKIYELDLQALGIQNTTEYADRFGGNGGIIELISNGKRQPISRYPNGDEVLSMTRVVQNGSNTAGDVGIFEYTDPRHADWVTPLADGKGVWLKGYYRVVWQLDALRVDSIDPTAKIVTFKTGISLGIGSKYQRPEGSGEEPYWLENLLEEVDEPGEWSVDFQTQKLHYYPDGTLEGVEISDLRAPVILLNDTNNVTVSGLNICGSLTNALQINNGSDNTIKGCEISLCNENGVFINNGFRNKVWSNDLHHIGGGGIVLTGGQEDPIIEANHEAVNNHIHHYCQNARIYGGAVQAGYKAVCVGARVAHNLIHDTPHVGILFGGQRNVIEYNDISRYCLFSNDMGGIYSFIRDDRYLTGENIVRHNLVHDAPNGDGIYMDNKDPNGNAFYSNIVYNVQRAYLFKDDDYDHNIYDNVAMNSLKGYQVPLTSGSIFQNNISINNVTDWQLSNATAAHTSGQLVLSENPGYTAPAEGEFTLDPTSLIYDTFSDFAPLDFPNVGLFTDTCRVIHTPPLLDYTFIEGLHSLTSSSKAQQYYALQSNTTLAPQDWITVTPKQEGTGDLLILIAPDNTHPPHKFYRIVTGLR